MQSIISVTFATALIIFQLSPISAQPQPKTESVNEYRQFGLTGECIASNARTDPKVVNLALDPRCNTYDNPSLYDQAPNIGDGFSFDLIVIGAGIASGYLANELTNLAGKDYGIGVFEERSVAGGRLMSARGNGALGFAVQNGDLTPPPEYGGMRIDPQSHYLTFNALAALVNAEEGAGHCVRTGEEVYNSLAEMDLGTEADCKGYLTKMNTASIRYFTSGSKDNFGEYLTGSNLTDYGSVVDATCLNLISWVKDFYAKKLTGDGVKELSDYIVPEAIDAACQACDRLNETFCEKCSVFPQPGLNIISCIGYDDLGLVNAGSGLNDAELVTQDTSKLYLMDKGTQHFAMNLLNNATAAATYFEKKAIRVEVLDENGTPIEGLAKKQAELVQGSKGEQEAEEIDPHASIRVTFEDGSQATAKAVYMTQVPKDLVKIEGFEAWETNYLDAFLPFGATKLFMYWKEGVPQGIKDATSSGKHRLVLDGEDVLGRQVFYWDAHTILVYQTAGEGNYAANRMSEIAGTRGMRDMIKIVTDQLSTATKTTVKIPTWARVKAWDAGSLAYYLPNSGSIGVAPKVFRDMFSRPMGPSMPVFYGSSEMNTVGNGWIEGSFSQVHMLLDEIEAAVERNIKG